MPQNCCVTETKLLNYRQICSHGITVIEGFGVKWKVDSILIPFEAKVVMEWYLPFQSENSFMENLFQKYTSNHVDHKKYFNIYWAQIDLDCKM